MLRRTTAVAIAIASLGLSACGDGANRQKEVSEPAESEALYRTLNGLKYQVQLSRQLNPRDSEDADYFRNLTPQAAFLPKGSVWFGVFLRVENEGKTAVPSAREFDIEDTQGNVFEPVESGNTFAYEPESVPAEGFIPDQERLQAYAGTQGSLLLFKIPLASLDNRPLELAIKSPNDTRNAARFDLDV